MKSIAIIGAGEFGQALGYLLEKAGQKIQYWDVDPSKLDHALSCEQVAAQADVIFFAVPSWCLRDCMQDALLSVSPHTVLVSVAKGVERETNATTEQIFEQVAGKMERVVFLSGPMLAEEIVEDKPTSCTLASVSSDSTQVVADLFEGSGLRVEQTDDVRGVVLCGVIKNIYTICIGMAAGLELGDNARGQLIVHAMHEMAHMVKHLGGKYTTVLGPAGLGDLVATSSGMFSRNFSYGHALVTNPENVGSAEGAASL